MPNLDLQRAIERVAELEMALDEYAARYGMTEEARRLLQLDSDPSLEPYSKKSNVIPIR